MSFRKLGVPYFRVLIFLDPTFSGTILGSPVFGNSHRGYRQKLSVNLKGNAKFPSSSKALQTRKEKDPSCQPRNRVTCLLRRGGGAWGRLLESAPILDTKSSAIAPMMNRATFPRGLSKP